MKYIYIQINSIENIQEKHNQNSEVLKILLLLIDFNFKNINRKSIKIELIQANCFLKELLYYLLYLIA